MDSKEEENDDQDHISKTPPLNFESDDESEDYDNDDPIEIPCYKIMVTRDKIQEIEFWRMEQLHRHKDMLEIDKDLDLEASQEEQD